MWSGIPGVRRCSGRALAQAAQQHAKAGPQSADAEQLRAEWVTRRLVNYGRTRARSLGWSDVYTLTKALGERVAEQVWAYPARPLSVVCLAIVESALRHPYPGWIDGFKMADPLIIAFGRGVLREFPGLPDSVLPVDLATDRWYTHLYRTSYAYYAYQGVHPFSMWYWGTHAMQHLDDVIFVGGDRSTTGRLGFRAASSLADALELASDTVGPNPQISYLHAPPLVLADVR